jgi:preprotein translocase subunit SecD
VAPPAGATASARSRPVDRKLAQTNLRTGLIAGTIAFAVFAAAFLTGYIY